MIKIGIIGHGFMGHEHEAMLSQLEGYQLVGFSDRDRSVLEDVRPGLKRYESNEALLLARHLRGDLDGYPPFLWK